MDVDGARAELKRALEDLGVVVEGDPVAAFANISAALTAFAAVYALVLISIAFASVTLIAAKLLRPRVEYARKLSTYECGIPAVGTTEIKLNIRFYLFALLFVLFDIETLYVYPWAVTAKSMGAVALVEMAVFLAILFTGLAYAWAKGALHWE